MKNILYTVSAAVIGFGVVCPAFAADATPRLSSRKGKQKILPRNANVLQVAGHTGYLA